MYFWGGAEQDRASEVAEGQKREAARETQPR
jgi:hypothetical protein